MRIGILLAAGIAMSLATTVVSAEPRVRVRVHKGEEMGEHGASL